MKATYRFAILSLLALVCVPSASGAYTSYGVGNKTCGTWVENRKRNDHYEMAQWMLGYISATGYYSVYRLRESEGQAFIIWMDNYCQDSPLEKFEKAVHELIESLREDRPRGKP